MKDCLNFEQFSDYYFKYKRLPENISCSSGKMLNDKQLMTKYEKYCQKLDKSKEKRYLDKQADELDERVMLKDVVKVKKEKISKPSGYKKDENWEKVKNIVYERDNYECQLMKKLSQFDNNQILKNGGGDLVSIFDPAHIFGKGAFPELKYDPDNVIVLNRYSHSMLDQHHHPITGVAINKEEHSAFWAWIVGQERYDRLLEKIINHKINKPVI